MKIRIIPYKLGSESAKLLATTLAEKAGYKVFRSGKPRANRRNIIWGKPQNKLTNFKLFEEKGVSCVPFSESKLAAQNWLMDGKVVLARTVSGQGGSGISIVEPGQLLPDRPLYTQYIKKKKEFRVHVVDGQVIDVQEKRKKKGAEADGRIRNHDNGWVFCHENIVEPADLRATGVAAVTAIDLQIGAVDIIWNEKQNKCFVLEVNSAPGLCPTTAEKYANALLG